MVDTSLAASKDSALNKVGWNSIFPQKEITDDDFCVSRAECDLSCFLWRTVQIGHL